MVTGKYARQRPAPPRPPRPRRRPPRGLGLGRRQGRRAARARAPRSTSATTSTTSRAPWPPASLSVSVLTGGCTREELEAAGTARRARRPRRLPGLARRAPARPPARGARGATCASAARCWSPSAAAPTARSCSPPRSARSAPTSVVAATGYSDSLPAVRARPGPRVRRVARRRGAHAGDPRDGARGLPRQRRRPLLLLQGRAARRARPARRRARARRTSRPAPTPTTPVAGFRPGIRAAAERGAVTPLRDAGLTKAQVREASRRWGLPTWDKPAAACLSSRVAYGVEVTPHRLARVERAEAAVRARCSRPTAGRDLRVRDLGDRASVEVDAAPAAAAPSAERGRRASTRVREAGFDEAEVDPRGFRSGSMNELLEPDATAELVGVRAAADIGCAVAATQAQHDQRRGQRRAHWQGEVVRRREGLRVPVPGGRPRRLRALRRAARGRHRRSRPAPASSSASPRAAAATRRSRCGSSTRPPRSRATSRTPSARSPRRWSPSSRT